MKKLFALMLLLLAGCAAPPVATTQLFNPADVAWAQKPGKNTIRGSALMRTVGGQVRSCGGSEVSAVPDSPYARERFMNLYGNLERGFNPALFGGKRADAADPRYLAATLNTICDAQGNFTFENVPDGVFFLTVGIIWVTNPSNALSTQGGGLMRRVTVSGGQSVSVVMAP